MIHDLSYLDKMHISWKQIKQKMNCECTVKKDFDLAILVHTLAFHCYVYLLKFQCRFQGCGFKLGAFSSSSICRTTGYVTRPTREHGLYVSETTQTGR